MRMGGFLSTANNKAFSLNATMYKGFASNGTTLVIDLYEADNDLPNNNG
jgi:hypothetical protein